MQQYDCALLNDLYNGQRYASPLYKAGPYWQAKTIKIMRELRKKKLYNFRGYYSGVGTSYCDNIIVNLQNEEVSKLTDLLMFVLKKIPIFSRFSTLLQRTQDHIISMHKQKVMAYELFLNNSSDVKQLLSSFKIEDTTNFGCVDAIKIGNKAISLHYLELLNTIATISKSIDFNTISSMFEIGGGFGANLHLMLSNFSNIKKVIYLDIVPNLYVGTEYLRSLYGDNVIDYSQTKNKEKITFKQNKDLEILCIAPWQIENLYVNIDYFHNAHSFVEMPENIIKNYAHFIKKLMSTNGKVVLVSYDHFDKNTTMHPDELNRCFEMEFKQFRHTSLLNPFSSYYYYVS
jgi:putative sugar O-methyltransferase